MTDNPIIDIIKSGRVSLSKMRAMMKEDSLKYGKEFVTVEGHLHPNTNFIRAVRSRDFLVQEFKEKTTVRLSINRVELNNMGTGWKENITWDEVQEIKRQLGYGNKCAVEIYPPDDDIVNVANIRHIWILDEPPVYMWRKDE